MGIFSKIKDHVKKITKSAKQIAKEEKELAETVAKEVKEQEKKIQQLNLENGTYFTQAEIVKDIAGASDETLAMFGKQNQELEKQVLIGKKIADLVPIIIFGLSS